ncbi:hypothetical protein SDC9_132786 [bioreactor metagenome]|uniref:Uncharacterized protein n=1 Tax=bioreactor metagenome TaxID=1076179 RepID=A0A645D928_9ZZZZ
MAAEEFDVAEQKIEADTPGDGAQRQVVAAHAQGNEPERQRDGGGQGHADEEREPGRDAVHRRQPGRGVGAEADKGRLAEGSQATDPGQQHEADGDDGIEADVVEQRDRKLRQQLRGNGKDGNEGEKRRMATQRTGGTGFARRIAADHFVALFFFLLDMVSRQGAPQQYGDDQREDDDFLEGTGVEG